MRNLGQPVPYVVHGSFRKHLKEINEAIETLDGTGVAKAIAPDNRFAIGEQDGFTRFTGEEGKDRFQIEAEYLRKVLSLKALGGFSLFVATDGYVGKSATYEYGIAQSCGIPTIFTEEPRDVPFYVDPQTIRNINQLSEMLVNHPDALLRPPRATNETANTWSSLAFPTALVAVGGIVRCTDRRIILSTDGRWQNHALTVPGSTVRVRETRDETLKRVLSDKLRLDPWNIKSVQPFATEFMIEDSGYDKPGVAIGTMVFDDRVIKLNNCTIGSTSPHLHPLTPDEVRGSIASGEVEPNAALLLTRYLHERQEL